MGNSLRALKVLTDNLPSFPNEESGVGVVGVKRHQMECGESLAFNLLNNADISCANWFNSAGTVFPSHVHEQREWMIVYRGSVYVTIEGKSEVRLLHGQSIVIDPGVSHKARLLEDCWFVAITVPQCSDWPV